MTMEILQIRLSENQIKGIDNLIMRGVYPSRSEAIRDAVRKFL